MTEPSNSECAWCHGRRLHRVELEGVAMIVAMIVCADCGLTDDIWVADE